MPEIVHKCNKGDKFNYLTVIKEMDRLKVGDRYMRVIKFRCRCGKIIIRRLSLVLSGRTQSCGCYMRERNSIVHRTHGESHKHPLYGVWRCIKSRCSNENNNCYHRYGGRGITVCYKWRKDYMSFYNWCIKNGWKKGLQIDRKNNNGNYTPRNCRIATFKMQSKNKSTNVYVTYKGQRMILTDACALLGIKYWRVQHRMKRDNLSFKQCLLYYKNKNINV